MYKLKFDKESKKSFTLIELLVVIAIIGLLASIVLVNVNSARSKARDARRIADLNQITKALELYYSEYGHYPRDYINWPGGNWGIIMTSAYAGIQPDWIGGSELDGNFMEEFIDPIPIDLLNGQDEEYPFGFINKV